MMSLVGAAFSRPHKSNFGDCGPPGTVKGEICKIVSTPVVKQRAGPRVSGHFAHYGSVTTILCCEGLRLNISFLFAASCRN